jgi:hypothetical protein
MFAVLETVDVQARRGRVTVCHTPRYVRIALESPLKAREGRRRKQALRGLRAASRLGAAGVVLPKDFPFPELPEMAGLAVSSPVPLLRRLAAPLCRFAVAQASVPWGSVRLSLVGNRSTPELLAAAQDLSGTVRNIHIDAGEDSRAACYLLRSRCGVPASSRPVRAADGFWDVFILFGVTAAQPLTVPSGAFVLNLTGFVPALSGGLVADGALLEPPRPLWKGWPAGCDNNALLAALLATGQVSLHDIKIRALTQKETPLQISVNIPS